MSGTSFRGAQLEGHAHGEQITAAITAPDGGGDEEPVEFEMMAPIGGLEPSEYRWIIFRSQAGQGLTIKGSKSGTSSSGFIDQEGDLSSPGFIEQGVGI